MPHKWMFKLNSTPAEKETWHLTCHILKDKPSKEKYLYLEQPCQTPGAGLWFLCPQVKVHIGGGGGGEGEGGGGGQLLTVMDLPPKQREKERER